MATTKRKHPNTYRVGRQPLLLDGKVYGPGEELPAPTLDEPETVLVGGRSYYKDDLGLFVRDDFGQRWDVYEEPSKISRTPTPTLGPAKETKQETLERLVARGDAWAPGDGPDDKEKATR